MYPQNKAFLVVSQLLIWVVFTLVYAAMDSLDPNVHFGPGFNPPYFATITQLTIGFGDIAPKTLTARMLVSVHVIISSFTAIMFV